jgi:hypothetical protein
MSSAVPSAVHRPSVRAGVLAVLLALLLPVLAVSGSSPARASSCDASSGAGTYGGGNGDPGTPYLICSPDHLAHLAATSGHWGKEFRQTADITLPAPASGSTSNHTPIGDPGPSFNNPSFTGVYDGGGFQVIGLRIVNATGDALGFFGTTDGAKLSNVHLADAAVAGRNNIGGLVGIATGVTEVSFASVSGDITGSNNTVGGLVGQMRAGGVIEDSFTSGSVTGTSGGSNYGGLVGSATGVTIRRSFSTADVFNPNTSSSLVGGLVGRSSDATLAVESFATGSVEGLGNAVGGLFGYAEGTTEIRDSYATGTVTGAEDRVGGLVGEFNGQDVRAVRSYSVGAVTGGSGASAVGGLVGRNFSDVVTASFWDEDTSMQSASAGGSGAVGRTTAQMKSIGTFSDAGWAIVPRGVGGASDVWGICTRVNDGYPFLLWQVDGASSDSCGGAAPEAGPSFVAPGGVLPSLSVGLGEWVQSDGSSVPLAVSSPGPNQVRYSAEGVQVTFTGGAGSDASRGLVANPNGEIVCEVCVALAAGQVIEAWMFSEPRLVAAWRIEDLPCQTFSIPVASPLDGGGPVSAGAHTLQLALPTASGMQAVNVGVTVGGPVPASVPAGEGPVVPGWLVAFGLLAAAGAVVAARRQVVAG